VRVLRTPFLFYPRPIDGKDLPSLYSFEFPFSFFLSSEKRGRCLPSLFFSPLRGRKIFLRGFLFSAVTQVSPPSPFELSPDEDACIGPPGLPFSRKERDFFFAFPASGPPSPPSVILSFCRKHFPLTLPFSFQGLAPLPFLLFPFSSKRCCLLSSPGKRKPNFLPANVRPLSKREVWRPFLSLIPLSVTRAGPPLSPLLLKRG